MTRRLAILLSATLLGPAAFADDFAEVIVPSGEIKLLERPRDAFHFHLDPRGAEDPADTAGDVFRLEDGVLTISGRTWGYLRTKERYRDYHLTLEYRFTGPTSGERAEKARDSGLLLHCFGADGSRSGGTWLPCLEVQIMEGATGDFIALGPFDNDGTLLPVYLESRAVTKGGKPVPFFDPEGEPIAIPGAEKLTNAISSAARSVDWQAVKGFHKPGDADHPTGDKWNRLEVICEGDGIIVRVNGRLVNRGWHVSPTVGYLGLQSEGAEIIYRNWVLRPAS